MDDESGAGDPSLDFLSPSFDPLKALSTSPSKILLPCPRVQPCDNLEVYKSVVRGRRKPAPTGARGTVSQLGSVGTSSRATVEASKPIPVTHPGVPQVKTVLSFMQRSDPGPFKILQQCQRDGSRVRVWIRHCVGVRGVCEGVPVVYDQHMNLVLRDVVEHYTPFRTVANGGIEGPKKKKKKKRKKIRTRVVLDPKDILTPPVDEPTSKECIDSLSLLHTTTRESSEKAYVTSIVGSTTAAIPEELTRQLKQLFIRGDNVLMVAALSTPIRSEDSAAT